MGVVEQVASPAISEPTRRAAVGQRQDDEIAGSLLSRADDRRAPVGGNFADLELPPDLPGLLDVAGESTGTVGLFGVGGYGDEREGDARIEQRQHGLEQVAAGLR